MEVENDIKPLQNTSLQRTTDKADKKRHFLDAITIVDQNVKPTEYLADGKEFPIHGVHLPEKPHIHTKDCRHMKLAQQMVNRYSEILFVTSFT